MYNVRQISVCWVFGWLTKLCMPLLLSLLWLHPTAAIGKVIHKERSLYQTILVSKERKLLCLKFSVRREQRNQSCINQRDPKRMVFAYTRMMLSALLFNPNPQRVLIVGLGGGTLPLALNELYPDAEIDVVEIDAAVVRVARSHFNYNPSAKVTTHTMDARVFTKRRNRQISKGRGLNELGYDLIMLDAFNGEYIPEHLMTKEYFQETANLLTDNGLVVANTFALSKLYDHESVTFEAAFGPLLNFTSAETGNRVMLAAPKRTLDPAATKDTAKRLAAKLRPYGVDIMRFPKKLTSKPDWDINARILTDQYNPANLLSRQRR